MRLEQELPSPGEGDERVIERDYQGGKLRLDTQTKHLTQIDSSGNTYEYGTIVPRHLYLAFLELFIVKDSKSTGLIGETNTQLIHKSIKQYVEDPEPMIKYVNSLKARAKYFAIDKKNFNVLLLFLQRYESYPQLSLMLITYCSRLITELGSESTLLIPLSFYSCFKGMELINAERFERSLAMLKLLETRLMPLVLNNEEERLISNLNCIDEAWFEDYDDSTEFELMFEFIKRKLISLARGNNQHRLVALLSFYQAGIAYQKQEQSLDDFLQEVVDLVGDQTFGELLEVFKKNASKYFLNEVLANSVLTTALTENLMKAAKFIYDFINKSDLSIYPEVTSEPNFIQLINPQSQVAAVNATAQQLVDLGVFDDGRGCSDDSSSEPCSESESDSQSSSMNRM